MRDRILYHQIHPLKLAVDWGTAFLAAWQFWDHRPALACLIGLVPPIGVSLALLRWADLTPYRDSPFGHYLGRTMTRGVEVARLVGLLPLWGGAWRHSSLLMATGVAWIAGCWGSGLWRPHDTP